MPPVAKLAASPHLSRLQRSSTSSSNAITRTRALPGAASASPHPDAVARVALAKNKLRDTGTRALAESPYLTRLAVLDFCENSIGGPGIRALAESPNLAGLRELNLAGNFVGPTGVPNPGGRRRRSGGLVRLDLSRCRFEIEAARALADAPP